jgi:hypothetical protein
MSRDSERGLRLRKLGDPVKTISLLVGIAAFTLWSLFMGYLLTIGVWADSPPLGDDPASGDIERGLYALVWLVGVVVIAAMTASASRERR